MPYLIDGNNLMAHLVGPYAEKGKARQQLLQELARFVSVHKVKLSVVFDGVPDDEYPEGMRYKSVRILYAKPGSDADTRIKDLVRRSSYKRDLVVVTSDKALGSKVSHYGAKVITARRFGTELAESAGKKSEKPEQNSPVDVEEWLAYFGQRKT